ncbi:hypothetical protein GCM10023094_28490 [Rhodococcus olei]|uniref:Deazaflavin-dependent oxidoreductase (Nitroreductase family) n=1 Tax=Rhodococcus olei TaxID=2161675 RepID=A0ABP8P2R7_9NOCA
MHHHASPFIRRIGAPTLPERPVRSYGGGERRSRCTPRRTAVPTITEEALVDHARPERLEREHHRRIPRQRGTRGWPVRGSPSRAAASPGAQVGARAGESDDVPAGRDRPGQDLCLRDERRRTHPSPDWYLNLVAADTARVERGTETYAVSVSEVTGDERDRIYTEQARRYPGFATYAEQTAGVRTIPVVALTRLPG